MMSERLASGGLWSSLVLLALGIQVGCRSPDLQLVSYKDPFFPEPYQIDLAECVYWVEPAGSLHVVARTPADSGHSATIQYLHVHLFWHPRPGKTPADRTMTDALLRYLVVSDRGVAVYKGTGFAFPKKARDGGLQLCLESGRLRPESHSGDLPDLLGSSRLSGTLKARADGPAAINLMRQMELLAAGHG